MLTAGGNVVISGVCDICAIPVGKPSSGEFDVVAIKAKWELLENKLQLAFVMKVPAEGNCNQMKCLAIRKAREEESDDGFPPAGA